MGTATEQFVPVDNGADALTSIFGNIKAAVGNLAYAYKDASNSLAALEAQNSDIANGRWTLNNMAYQFGQLSPAAQAALVGALAWVVVAVVKGRS